MTRILLTGGSGFIATHILDLLLSRGHSVVTTIRTQDKADQIAKAHPEFGSDKLSFAIVSEIGVEGAFDEAVKSERPFEAVIHTASPFRYNVADVQKELLDPAVIGTTGILESIQKYAPGVKKVIITSSFAAINDPSKGNWPEHTYSEADWNPMTQEQALENPGIGYVGSKAFAERAAWDFVEGKNPGFTITTFAPPYVFGPVKHVNSLNSLNESNKFINSLIRGEYKNEIPQTFVFLSVDVRDLALGHVLAVEKPDAANKRFFFAGGHFSNKEIAEVIRQNFPEYRDVLPGSDAPGGDYPAEGIYGIDNSQAKELLGSGFISLQRSIVDTVNSLKKVSR